METKNNILEYISSIFEKQGKRLENGDYSIEMAVNSPKYLVAHLYYNTNIKTVEVVINGAVMGTLVEYSGQGYKYKFEQRYRVGIRNGRTIAEQFMEDICNGNPFILFQRAYH